MKSKRTPKVGELFLTSGFFVRIRKIGPDWLRPNKLAAYIQKDVCIDFDSLEWNKSVFGGGFWQVVDDEAAVREGRD